MRAQLQKRIQRYGWDRAADCYEQGWREQLQPAQSLLLEMAALVPGERVLDVACGTGLVSFRALEAVGPQGAVLGTDISEEMVATARRRAERAGAQNIRFARLDAESQDIDDEPFSVALCALGLMYVPDPYKALGEMRRLLRAGGRAAAAVWGARANCGWAEIFPITDACVESDVCPLFFALGTGNSLAECFSKAGFESVRAQRVSVTLHYASPALALDAAFRGGPVALAYNRFDSRTRELVHEQYLHSIEPYRSGNAFNIPGEFVVASGVNPS